MMFPKAIRVRLTDIHPTVLQSFLVIQALYGLAMCTVKWSMLFMLKRIFAVKPFEVGAPSVDSQHSVAWVLLIFCRCACRS